jgi:hypothetical protein
LPLNYTKKVKLQQFLFLTELIAKLKVVPRQCNKQLTICAAMADHGGEPEMKVSTRRLAELLQKPVSFPGFGEYSRNQAVFLLGDGLPLQPTMEALFASDCESPVELYHFTFSTPAYFTASLSLAHQIQKNFKGYRMARFLYRPSLDQIDAAYAAGLELLDLPSAPAGSQKEADDFLALILHARSLFARWAVVASLVLERPEPATQRKIEEFLALGIIPVLYLPASAPEQENDWLSLYLNLGQQWRQSKANLKPIMPLLLLCTPLLAGPPRTGVDRLLEVANAASQRATADLRRLLRVRGAEQSFDSAAL